MIKKNIKKLDEWYESIGSPKLIPIAEAKELYRKMVALKNSQEQKMIFDELVLGTIPVVYKNIKNSYLPYIAYNEYDIEDILQTGIEIWLNILKDGTLLQIECYSKIFKYNNFFWKLKRYYTPSNFYNLFFDEYESDFGNHFYEYILDKRENEFEVQLTAPMSTLFKTMYSILDDEIQLFDQEEHISKRQIKIITPFLTQKALNKAYNEKPNFLKNLAARDNITETENEVIKEEFIKVLKEQNFSPKYQYILHMYYFCNKTHAEIAKKYDGTKGWTTTNISAIHRRIIRKLQDKTKIKSFEDLDMSPQDYPHLTIKKR